MIDAHYAKRIWNPLIPHLFQMQTHQAVLEGISILLLHILAREFVCLHDLTIKMLLQEYTNCPLLN